MGPLQRSYLGGSHDLAIQHQTTPLVKALREANKISGGKGSQ